MCGFRTGSGRVVEQIETGASSQERPDLLIPSPQADRMVTALRDSRGGAINLSLSYQIPRRDPQYMEHRWRTVPTVPLGTLAKGYKTFLYYNIPQQ